MKLDYLKEFIELSADLNFTAAARRLNLSVSALSTHVSALESLLGVMLVNRCGSHSLTPEGKVFLDYAYRIVDLYAEAVGKCRDVNREPDGTLKIDKVINTSATGYNFRKFIFAFGEEHPGVNVQLVQSVNTAFVHSLLEGNVDVAMVGTLAPDVIAAMLKNEGISSIFIGKEEVSAWVAMKGPFEHAETLTLEDLGKCAIAHSQEWRLDIWRESLRHLLEPVGVVPRIRLNFFGNLSDYAMGKIPDDEISLVSHSTAENSGILRLRKDRECKVFDPPLYISMFVCHRTDDGNPVTRRFIDDLLREHPVPCA